MRILIAILLSVFLSNCGTRYVALSEEPFEFQKTKEPKKETIRVHENDQELYKAYIQNFRRLLHFHNAQIDAYKESMKKLSDKENE